MKRMVMRRAESCSLLSTFGVLVHPASKSAASEQEEDERERGGHDHERRRRASVGGCSDSCSLMSLRFARSAAAGS